MQETLPSGEVIDYEYDADSGLETRRVYSLNGNPLYEVVTDWNFATGQLLSVTDPTGTTTYHYDPNTGAFAGLDYPNNSSIRYQRDELGRVEKVTVKPDKDGATEYVTEYEYDANGNIEKVTDPNTQATVMIYDKVNRLEERTLPNGIKTVYTYEENTDFIEKIVHYAPDGVTVMSSVEYIRSDSGEPTKITREDGSYVELKYDESLRLEKETYYDANGVQEEEIAYSYDAEGNRQTVSSGEAQGSYDYENIHQLTQIDTGEGLETYHYDDGGRLETITREEETWEFLYNADDLIIEVKKGDNIVVQYAYDSAGRRVEMMDGAGEKDYVVAPLMGEGLESPHLVMDGANDPLAAYVYAGNMPLMRLDDQGNPTYYLEDGMGSIVGLADGSGVEVAEFEYDSFGNLRNGGTGMPNELGGDFRFQGQWLESNTDFYHFRARYYDPETGRFVSRDPVDVIEYEPESSNPYQFVYNNPHVYSDPTGMFTISELNVNNVIQNILNSIKSELVSAAKQEAIDKAQGIVGDLVGQFISTVVPVEVSAFGEVISLAQELARGGDGRAGDYAGDLVEEFIFDVGICPILPDNYAHFLWREPTITTSGRVVHNGRQCNSPPERPGPRTVNGVILPNPDFAISAFPLRKLQTGPGRKGWLIGDTKIGARTIKTDGRGNSQWDAMISFAKTRQYVPSVLYVTFFGGHENELRAEEIERIAAKKGVIAKVLPLINR